MVRVNTTGCSHVLPGPLNTGLTDLYSRTSCLSRSSGEHGPLTEISGSTTLGVKDLSVSCEYIVGVWYEEEPQTTGTVNVSVPSWSQVESPYLWESESQEKRIDEEPKDG